MPFKSQLHANDVASYRWGSLAARFSPLARVHSRTLPETLAGLIAGACVWKTEPEFRRIVAFMHECVHYFQDILTGVGHWDYLVQKRNLPRLLGAARNLSWLPNAKPPYDRVPDGLDKELVGDFLTNREDLLAEEVEESLYVPTAQLPSARKAAVIKALTTPALEGRIDEEVAAPCFIENLLESEATATVWWQMYSLGLKEGVDEIAAQNKSLFHPAYMGPQYFLSAALFFNSLEVDLEGARDRGAVFAGTCQLFTFFADLACAHPSPRLLEQVGAQRADYEPGVKFVRLIRAFRLFGAEEDEAFQRAYADDRDVWAAEDLLLRHCEYPYLRSKEVYEDWHALFEERLRRDNDHILQIRQRGCHARLHEPVDCVTKTLFGLMSHEVPLFVLTPPGFTFYGFTAGHLDTQERNVIIEHLLAHNRDLELADYFLQSGRFVCPLAEAKMCGAATPACLSGITDNALFPPAPGCHVRAALARDFKLEREEWEIG